MSIIKVDELSPRSGSDISITSLKSITGTPSQFKITGGTAGQALITDGSGGLSFGDAGSSLPSQTGQAGKFLTTDGTIESWDTVDHTHSHADELPSQTSQAGKFLKTDGTTVNWDTVDEFSVSIAEAAPGSASSGALWWKSDEGRLKIYYNDGSSSQWVDAFPVAEPGATDPAMGGDLTGTASNAQIATDAVTANEILAGAVGTAELASGAVTSSELAATLDLSSKTVTLPAASVTAHVSPVDVTGIHEDIALLGFKIAAASSLSKYNLSDQIIDEFSNNSGIDVANSTNAGVALSYLSGISAQVYMGDGSDGAFDTAGNGSGSGSVDWTVPNPSGSYDGDMVVKQFTSMTITAGDTVSVDHKCRGMLILVTGDCTINGKLSMHGKGAFADPTTTGGSDANFVQNAGITMSLFTGTGSDTDTLVQDGTNFNGCGTLARTVMANQPDSTGNGNTITIVRKGVVPSSNTGGTTGTSGATGESGAGGGGGWNSAPNSNGEGSYGSCFTGGSGGGGSNNGQGQAGNAVTWGGAGGIGATNHTAGCGGGAGNPVGGDDNTAGASRQAGADNGDGTGGLLILLVGGDLTIGASGKIDSSGCNGIGFTGGNGYMSGGGGSGGGPMVIAYNGTLVNSGSIDSSGGAGGIIDGGNSQAGGAGGTGSQQTVDLGFIAGDCDAKSTANVVTTAPTNSDMIMLYDNGFGTTTLNTDLKGYVSRDGGTSWTEQTLVDGGNQGPYKMVTAHNVPITSATGTDVRWRVTTHNQVALSLETRVHALSMGWS